ncbi:hypothetical protein [Bacillus altitudinis]|uniref:hypothetical protein n=1 Tax=Bacillus altitudinis TaxID=293387 RepID=UPI0011A590FE|nr:hypothetical protein [Bacillus altitudinis]
MRYEDLMVVVGYIEEEKVDEMKGKYEWILKMYERAVEKDVEHVAILDGEQWERLSAQEMRQVNE